MLKGPLKILGFIAALSLPAHAVVPGLMGPLQALLALIPQILGALIALLGSWASLSYWRGQLRQNAGRLGKAALILLICAIAVAVAMRPRTAILASPSPLATAVAATPQCWPSFRGDAAGLGTLDGKPLAVSPTQLWSHVDEDYGEYISSPVEVDGRVYVGYAPLTPLNQQGSVQCLNATDGTLIWRQIVKYPVFSSPVIANGKVYCGEGLHENQDARLYCFDAATGANLFNVPTRGHVEASPTLVGDRLVFGAGDDGVYCVEAATGKSLWHSLCGHCDSSSAIADGRVFMGTAYGNNTALCLDLSSGNVLWRAPQDLPVWGNAAVSGSRVCFGLGNGTFDVSDAHPRGAAICLDAASGRQLWRTEVGDSINAAMAISGSDVMFGSRDGNLYCLNLEDGKLRWKALCGKPLLASLVVSGNTVIQAGGDGALYGIARGDGKQLWRIPLNKSKLESSPMLADGRLYLGAGFSLTCLGK